MKYASVDQWIHVVTKYNPAYTGGLQLGNWVKDTLFYFLTTSPFPFVPIKEVMNNIIVGVTQAVTVEDIVSLASSVKNRQLPFRRFSHLIRLVLIKSVSAFNHTFSEFYRKNPITVPSMVALLTLKSRDRRSRGSSLVLDRGESFESENKNLFDEKDVKWNSRISP